MARKKLNVEHQSAYHEGATSRGGVLRPTGKLRRMTIVPDKKAGSRRRTQHWSTSAVRWLNEGAWVRLGLAAGFERVGQ